MIAIPSWSWSNAALASLVASVASVAGQQIVLIPLSLSPPSSTSYDRSLYEAEPPCRQRRLEPWRQQVREQCRADVESRCPSEQRDLHRGERSGAYISFHSSPSPASALFGDVFFGRDGASVADPFDDLFNRMLGASLRAFDQIVIEEEEPSVDLGSFTETPGEEEKQEEEQEEKEGGGEEHLEASSQDEEAEYLDVSPPSSEDASSEDASSEDASLEDNFLGDVFSDGDIASYVASAPTPEQAAENALDFMVASLAAQVKVAESASADVKNVEDEATSEDEEVQGIPASTTDLPALLSQRGHALLAEAAGASERRRLTEGAAVEDPRAKVKVRLARRLTEYRTDLFYAPADGTVTLYTISVLDAAQPREAPPPALGLGSHQLDGCVRSAFRNRDLSGDCHQAVGAFLLAVDHGSPASPYHGEFSPMRADDTRRDTILLIVFGTLAISLAGLLFMVLMDTVEHFFNVGDDEDSWAEEDGEFDYAAMPDGDTNQVTGGGEDLDEARVFVGIPLQVV